MEAPRAQAERFVVEVKRVPICFVGGSSSSPDQVDGTRVVLGMGRRGVVAEAVEVDVEDILESMWGMGGTKGAVRKVD